jgi:tRNA-specific 2-thiouridylase
VGRIDAQTNTIALGTKEEICSRTVAANWINVLVPEELIPDTWVFGKIRSYGDPGPCRVIEVGENNVTVEFDEPQFAPCPGQKLVLYNGCDQVIAGGTMTA